LAGLRDLLRSNLEQIAWLSRPIQKHFFYSIRKLRRMDFRVVPLVCVDSMAEHFDPARVCVEIPPLRENYLWDAGASVVLSLDSTREC
jgi:hypothetical protein